MAVLSLYESCLQKIAALLRSGFFNSCQENPFCFLPYNFINDLMATYLKHPNPLRAADLRMLLTSGRLRELKIYNRDLDVPEVIKMLHFLKSGCQELEVLHVTGMKAYFVFEPEGHQNFETSEALENLLRNCPNLKNFHSCFIIDLKALRNCKKLLSVRFYFWPQQHWYSFLVEDNGQIQPHEHLEFFTVCDTVKSQPIPYSDIAIILRHCPALTSFGYLNSSEALSLHKDGLLPSKLNLRDCHWKGFNFSDKSKFNSQVYSRGELQNAIQRYPEEEDHNFFLNSLKSLSCLKNLKYLDFLNITSYFNNKITMRLDDVFKIIGPQLKHLFLLSDCLVDVSILVENCPNLISLRIDASIFTPPKKSNVHLPNLHRFTFKEIVGDVKRILPQLSDCNQLTELFLLSADSLDDKTLSHFMNRNSMSNLKVAYFQGCSLTKEGIRKFLQRAPQLEMVNISSLACKEYEIERIIRETHQKAVFKKNLDEFFERKTYCRSS